EVRHDLVGQIDAGAVVAPGPGRLAVELVGLAGELAPVLAGGDGPFAGGVDHGEVLGLEGVDGSDGAAFGGLDVPRSRAPAQERVADVRAQERDVLGVVDLVAD